MGAAVLGLWLSPSAGAEAAGRKAPPITESAGRCDVAALDKFADVSGWGQSEAHVTLAAAYCIELSQLICVCTD